MSIFNDWMVRNRISEKDLNTYRRSRGISEADNEERREEFKKEKYTFDGW